ncbi:MAG: 2-phospho-L-lactate guanylyltransferase [Halobacteriales archaeon]
MRVLVPYAPEEPKTRLSDALDAGERAAFSRAMLADVLGALREAGREPEVLATAPVEVDASVTVDERPLTPAVNAALGSGPVAVVMADLPLATPAALERLFGTPGDVVIAPGRGGGTNALVARDPAFRVDYHGASYLDHLRAARAAGASVGEVDSHRLATDIDEPGDLVELLLHGEGAAREWLRDAGFELDLEGGRVGVRRA